MLTRNMIPHTTPMLKRSLISVLVSLLWAPLPSHADCIDNLDGTYTCSDTSDNSGSLTGSITLDNSAAPATLINQETGSLMNDPGTAGIGASSLLQTANGNQAVTISNQGMIYMDRSWTMFEQLIDSGTGEYILDPATGAPLTSWSALNGELQNMGMTAGIASAINSGSNTPSLVFNNAGAMATLLAAGDFSAAILANNAYLEINNQAQIINTSYFGLGGVFDTRREGHWAIASFAGADISAPALQDGSQYASVNRAGMTVIDNVGLISGDIVVADRNPLLDIASSTAAIAGSPSLALAYSADQVGPRNSVIINRIEPGVGAGGIYGNIYLGSGHHSLLNDSGGNMMSNLYIDQNDSLVTDSSGTPLYRVVGDKVFDFVNNGNFLGSEIVLNDTVGAQNTITFNAGYFAEGEASPNSVSVAIRGNGLGNNTVNLNCASLQVNTGSAPCGYSGSMSGMTTLNLLGTRWNMFGQMQLTGNANLQAQQINLDQAAVIEAANTIISSNALLHGYIWRASENLGGSRTADTIGSINGNLLNNGSINLGGATMNVSGDLVLNNGSSVLININPLGHGNFTVGGSSNISAAAVVVPSFTDVFIRSGEVYTIATNANGLPVVQNGSGIVQFTPGEQNGNLVLVSNVAIPVVLGVSRAGHNAVNTVMGYSGSDPTFMRLATEIQGLDGAQLRRAAESLHPETNDGAMRMVLTHTDKVFSLLDGHLFDLHMAKLRGEPEAIETGSPAPGKGIWFQGFGGSGSQDARKGGDGYHSNSTGMAAGIDRVVGDSGDLRVGAALAFAYGSVNNSGLTSSNRVNINSYQAFGYAMWAPDTWYLNGAIGLGRHTYATRRSALNRAAEADHDSWQASARLEAGYPMSWNEMLTFVPIASLSYNRIAESSYSERGSEVISSTVINELAPAITVEGDTAIRLHVNSRSFNSYRAGIGGKVLLSFQQPEWSAGIELHAMMQQEFGDVSQDTRARFIGHSGEFDSPGMRPARQGITMGGTLRLTGRDNLDQLSLLASYDADMRSQYLGQLFSLMLRYDLGQGPSYTRRIQASKQLAQSRAIASIPVEATSQDVAALAQAMAPGLSAEQQAVQGAIAHWLEAISNSNVAMYLGSYAADFSLNGAGTRQQWERARTQEIQASSKSDIRIADLKIQANGKQASTVFTQITTQGEKQQMTQKIIDLEQRQGRWLITSEDSIPLR